MKAADDVIDIEVSIDGFKETTRRPVVLFMIRLWSINRWFRWTGFRFVVETADLAQWTMSTTRLGVVFWGWRGWTEGYRL